MRLPTANDFARAVAADDSGVYVVGQRDREGVIRKYDPGGNDLWTLELDAPGDGYHAPLGVTVDATGIYVAGVLQPTGESTVGFLRKYTRNGVQVWDRQFGQIARGVALDANGLLVVGWSARPVDSITAAGSNFLRRFNTNGDELWTRHFGGMQAGIFADAGITADFSGVYVPGTTRDRGALPGQCSQGAQDAVVLKFDSNGTEVWERQVGTWQNDYARTVTTDATALYVAGDRLLAKFEKAAVSGDASRPRIGFGCVVNAASHLGGGVAPGEIVTIFGSGIGPPQLVSQRIEEGRLAAELAETRILFNGVPAPLLYVSDREGSAVVPYGVAGSRSVQVQVEYCGVRSDSLPVPVLIARPGIFTRDGTHAVALNEDGSVNSASNPARGGSVLTLFATGEGLTSPRVPDGIILGSTLAKPASEVLCTSTFQRTTGP